MAISVTQQAIEAPIIMPIQALKTIVVTGANRAIELEVSDGTLVSSPIHQLKQLLHVYEYYAVCL